MLANRGEEVGHAEWDPTAEYLTESISGYRFHIVPLSFDSFIGEVTASDSKISFISANPSLYAYLEYHGEVRRLATMLMPGEEAPQSKFGGVLFTRSTNNEINEISDLKGVRFAAVDSLSLGGWHAVLREIAEHGLNPSKKLASIHFKRTHDDVVRSVLAGTVDAGTVRSTQLERMAAEGHMHLDQIKVIHSQRERYPEYPALLSTRLYPEWPFASTMIADDKISKQVAIALLQMPSDHPATSVMHSAGWTVPEQYDEVIHLLRILSLPPFDDDEITLAATIRNYGGWLMAILLLLILSISFATLTFIHSQRTRKIAHTLSENQHKLSHSNELMRYVIEHANSAVAILDTNLNHIYVSEQFSKSFGVETQEILGKNHYDVFPDLPQKWKTVHQRALNGEILSSDEDEFVRESGEIHITRWECRPWHNEFGAIGGIIIYTAVITDEILKERELKLSEEKFRVVSENTYHWEFWEREDGSFIYNSPACERISGYSVEEFEKDSGLLLEIIHPDDREHYHEHRLKTWRDPEPDECTFRLTTKAGDLKYIEHVCQPAYNEQGDFIGIRGTNIDVTERKGVENRLIESEKRFREIFETLPVISVQGYDRNRRVIYWNRASEELYGYSRKEALGSYLEDLIIPDELKEKVACDIQNWIEKGEAIPSEELILKKKDGSRIHVYSNHVLLKNPAGEPELFCIDIDLTELKQNQLKLQQSQERYRSIISLSNTGAWEYNRSTDQLWVSPEYLTMLGYDPSEFNSDESSSQVLWGDLIHPDDKKEAMKIFSDYYSGTMDGYYENYFRLKHKNGSDVWIWSRGSNIKNPDGSSSDLILGTHIDITDLHKKTKEVEESDLYHRSLLQTIPDIVFVLSRDGTFLDVKYSDSDKLWIQAEDFIGKRISEVLPDDLVRKQMHALETCYLEKSVAEFDYSINFNDEIRYYNSRNVAFGDDKVIASVRDVTDLQENLNRITQLLSVQEKQNEKLRNFTHIVSHNLRSHTANIEGILSLLEIEEPELYSNAYVDLIKTSSDSLNETIDNLNQVLDMSLDKSDDIQPIDLNHTVERVISTVSTIAKQSGVELKNEIEEKMVIRSIPAYLESIVLNMLTNGIRFKGSGSKSHVKVSGFRQNSEIVLLFEDNGVGIDLDLFRDKLFGMYKTFHGHVESKGLGLFMTKNQVEAMGGRIEVESEVNRGTVFTIYLPDSTDGTSATD